MIGYRFCKVEDSQLTPASASSKLTPSISKSNSGPRNSSLETVGFGGAGVTFGGSAGRANGADGTILRLLLKPQVLELLVFPFLPLGV